MEAFSMGLRERVMAAYDAGEGGSRAIAARFGVSGAFVRKLLMLRRQHGSIAALPRRRGRKPKPAEKQLDRLCWLVAEKPDRTLGETRRRLRLPVSISTLSLVLRKLGFTR
ncbi:MAG: helix-turn-helix domain-containing protein, partial [Planctomycetota bacterium]